MSIPGDGWLDFDWGDGTAITSVRPPVDSADHQYATNGPKAIVVRATRADHTTETGRGTAEYVVAPGALQSITPSGGPAAGGTPVTLIGTGLTGTTFVFFASGQATNLVVVSDGMVTCTAPAGTPNALVNVNALVRGPATNSVQFQYGAAEEDSEETGATVAPSRTTRTTRKRAT